jgi:hypothetical protein
VMKELVGLRRELVKDFNGLLAKSLIILNALLLDAGRPEEAPVAEEEAKALGASIM